MQPPVQSQPPAAPKPSMGPPAQRQFIDPPARRYYMDSPQPSRNPEPNVEGGLKKPHWDDLENGKEVEKFTK